MDDPNGWEYDPDDHPIPEPYDEFYENRETRQPEWYPGWRLPSGSNWLQERMRDAEGQPLRPDDVCYIVNEPSTFPGEQPARIPGQLSLED